MVIVKINHSGHFVLMIIQRFIIHFYHQRFRGKCDTLLEIICYLKSWSNRTPWCPNCRKKYIEGALSDAPILLKHGKVLSRVPFQSTTCGQVPSRVPFLCRKFMVKCSLGCPSSGQNAIKCTMTFCVPVPHGIQMPFLLFSPLPLKHPLSTTDWRYFESLTKQEHCV